ncbi:MAG: hypothetical protein LBB94_03215 [Clostridiales bacterium]|nr:hypothetical protein [Clostridiales bacterium]
MMPLNKTDLVHAPNAKKIAVIALLLVVILSGLFLGAYFNGRFGFKNKTFKATFVSHTPPASRAA